MLLARGQARTFRLIALVAGLSLTAAAASPTPAAAGPQATVPDPVPPLSRGWHGAGLRRLAAEARQRFRAGDFAAALALRRRLLALAIRNSGSASRPAATAMAGLASLYLAMQRYLDAEPLLLVARRDVLAQGGSSDPALLPVLCGLARVARARGAAKQAQEWAAAAVALAAGEKPGRPSQYAAALRALGEALAAQRRFAESARALRRALALDEESDDGAAARDLVALGMIDIRQRRYAEALPLIEQAALIDQTWLGPTHPFIADDFHALGLAYLGLEHRAEAAAALRFAIWTLARGAGSGTARLAYAELTLARVMHEEGRAQKTKILFDDARHILGKAEDQERRREDRT
jgi:tetratricopeptide (TPR) repeat protein